MTRWDALTVLSALAVAGGVGWIYVPAGVIVGGLLGMAVGLMMDRNRNRNQRRR